MKGKGKPRKDPLLSLYQRWAEGYYRVRFEDVIDPSRSYEKDGFIRPWPPNKPIIPLNPDIEGNAEMAALVHSNKWTGVIITHCDNGKERYKQITVGQTKQGFSALAEGIMPFLDLLHGLSSRAVNSKHIVAYSSLVTLKESGSRPRPISYLLDRFSTSLGLDASEVDQLSDMGEAEARTFNTFNDLDLDCKLQRLFREQDMAARGMTLDARKLR